MEKIASDPFQTDELIEQRAERSLDTLEDADAAWQHVEDAEYLCNHTAFSPF
jgi:hypothetical protein